MAQKQSPTKIALYTILGTIFAAAVGAAAQAYVAWYNLKTENDKAEAARILQVVDTAKPTQTLKNLQFLVDTGLISGDLRKNVQKRLKEKQKEFEERMAAPFKEIHNDIVDVIGNPIRDAVLADDAYQAVYERASVIWIPLTIFVLPRDQTQPNNSVIRHREGFYEVDQRFFNDEELKKMFNPPDGKLPPHGGLAALWQSNPEKWKWIGWRGWHCRFFDKVYVQEFESGTVIGPLLVRPDRREGQVFIIPSSGRWSSLRTPTEASDCGTVGDQFRKPKNP
jgi:hypothetical protein